MKIKKTKNVIRIQILVIFFSLSNACIKMGSDSWSENGLFSIRTFLWIGLALFILGIYAIFWQIIIRDIDLSIAYLNKSTVIIWTLCWGILFFNEILTLANIMGVIFIFFGIYMVVSNE